MVETSEPGDPPGAGVPPARLGWVGLGYLAVVLIWGTTWYGIHTQVNGTAPHLGVALRMGAASLIFFAIAAAIGTPLRLSPRQARLVLIQGMCFFGFNYLTVYAGAQYLTSGVVAVVFSMSVPFNILAERFINGTRPNLAVVAAAAVGMGGIAMVFSTELERALATEEAVWGAALIVLSAAIVAVGNVLAVRLTSTRLSAIPINAYGMAAGAGAILLWGALSGAPWSLEITPVWLAGYAYLVLLGSVVAFGIYIKILPVIGSTAGAYVVVLSPIVALAISSVMEGLPLGAATLSGVALLLIGHSILVTQRRRAR